MSICQVPKSTKTILTIDIALERPPELYCKHKLLMTPYFDHMTRITIRYNLEASSMLASFNRIRKCFEAAKEKN